MMGRVRWLVAECMEGRVMWTRETCPARGGRELAWAGVRVSIVVGKRGNARGAKGHREVDA